MILQDPFELAAAYAESNAALKRAVEQLVEENLRLSRELRDYVDATRLGCTVQDVRRMEERFWETMKRLSGGTKA